MKEFYCDKGEAVDNASKEIIKTIHDRIVNNGDDAVLIYVGETGSGKSTLCQHHIDIFLSLSGETRNNDYVSFTPAEFWRSVGKINKRWAERMDAVKAAGGKFSDIKRGDFYIHADEMNNTRRTALNKETIMLGEWYNRNRLIGILSFWCFPALQILDRNLLGERVNGIFLVVKGSESNNGRVYYFFPKAALDKLLEENDTVTTALLKKSKDKYAQFMGRFKVFPNNELQEQYLWLKADSLKDYTTEVVSIGEPDDNKIVKDDSKTMGEFAKELNASRPFIVKSMLKLKDEGLLVDSYYRGDVCFIGKKDQETLKRTLIRPFSIKKIDNAQEIQPNKDISPYLNTREGKKLEEENGG